MKRFMSVVSVALLAVTLASTGCQRTVSVRTGTIVNCSYGHRISSSVHTVRVPADKAGDYRIKTITRVCDKHNKLEALYAQAQAAIADGDLKTAERLLTTVVGTQSSFHNAKVQLDTIKSGGKPSVDSTVSAQPRPSSPTTSSTPGDGTDTPAAGLLDWAPDTLAGFSASKPSIDAFAVSREYVPADSSLLGLVIVVEQFRDSAAAGSALERDVKAHYTRNATKVTINGHNVYLGTDGRRFAVGAFTADSVLVAVELSVRSGDPSGALDTVRSIVKQLP